MKFDFELTTEQTKRLREMARQLGLEPHDVVRAAVIDALNSPDAIRGL